MNESVKVKTSELSGAALDWAVHQIVAASKDQKYVEFVEERANKYQPHPDQNKPSWEDAPIGVVCLAQEPDGRWWWFRHIADRHGSGWIRHYTDCVDTGRVGKIVSIWEDTREYRRMYVDGSGYALFRMSVGGDIEYMFDAEIIPKYSTDWAQGGPLLDSRIIGIIHNSVIRPFPFDKGYQARASHFIGPSEGHTILIAACRAIVVAKLGDMIHVPKELIKDCHGLQSTKVIVK